MSAAWLISFLQYFCFSQCKMNHQYLGPGNAEPVILILIGCRELLVCVCVCARFWPLITSAVNYLKPSINTHFEFLYLRNSWFWFSVDVSRLLCLILMRYRSPKFGRVLIESLPPPLFWCINPVSQSFFFFLRLWLLLKRLITHFN